MHTGNVGFRIETLVPHVLRESSFRPIAVVVEALLFFIPEFEGRFCAANKVGFTTVWILQSGLIQYLATEAFSWYRACSYVDALAAATGIGVLPLLRENFPVMLIYDRVHIRGTTIAQFNCLPIQYSVETMVVWKVCM